VTEAGRIPRLIGASVLATLCAGLAAAQTPSAPTRNCAPAPQSWKSETPPSGVQEIHYESKSGQLLAWFATPKGNGDARYPVIVYLHGGFAFSMGDFEQTRPFLADGYAVLTPTLRAENGNPGCFEMFSGEVDDVLAAVRWVAGQPMVDKDRVYVFGHSIGGALSALACLRPDAGIRSGGAISGLYDDAFFSQRKAVAPFDIANTEEKHRRLFLTQVESLRVPFIFYLESSHFTPSAVAAVDSLAKRSTASLSAVLITGDHFSIIPAAMKAFIARLKSQESAASGK
jgi:acetyl esterase/lipase